MNFSTTRRRFLQSTATATAAAPFAAQPSLAAEATVPQSVTELWADFDPRRDPLETEVIREWREDGGVFRLVRFLVGKFRGQPARMAAIYGFPAGAQGKLPGVLHIHGGGQRAFLHEVKFLVARGYAALSVNWGGSGTGQPPFNAPEGAQPGDPNTDWGAVDPSQLNVPGYSSMLPGPKQFFTDREHPKNNNWYLLTLGCRRALTFLEQQPEVDAQRLGVHGYSMGGNLTMYVAGTDARVKAAVPGVGGQGWRWEEHEFTGGRARPQDAVKGDVNTFRRTLSFESYAPLIRCPVLHRSATNDFHGWMDDAYRTNALIPGQPTRYSWAPHFNHRLTPEVAVAMPLWLDQFLKGGPALPETPRTELALKTADGVPTLRVTPAKHAWPAARCDIYYSVDPDPRARFWRSADVTREGDAFLAKLPLHTLNTPLFAFANVHFTLPEPVSMKLLPGNGEFVREICLSSQFHHVTAPALREAGVKPTARPGPLVDDFSRGLRDWFQLNAGNHAHLQTWTRKLTDPLWRGPADANLKLTYQLARPNPLAFVIQENEWRNYRGPRRTFVCERELPGADAEQTVTLTLADFTSADGALKSWAEVDQFGICAYNPERPQRGQRPARPATWNGPGLKLLRLEWV